MRDWKNKRVMVIGLGRCGRAACGLLRRANAKVTAVDPLDTPALRGQTQELQSLGVDIQLGVTQLPAVDAALAVIGPTVPADSRLVREATARGMKVISELELGYQHARCLSIAVSGTNGKGTVAGIIESLLTQNHRKAVVAGQPMKPVSSAADRTHDLDFLVVQAETFQLGLTEYFRPVVAVLTNLAPDHLDRYDSEEGYIRANARVFACQQQFDWAVVQRAALERIRSLQLPLQSKVITFSAHDEKADIYLDRGLIISRVPNWSGPLLDIAHCRLQGPHNAENLMAALAVGRALRIPLDAMVDVLKEFPPGVHRFEMVAEIDGVQFINDSKAMNPNALEMALLAARSSPGGQPNVWLIAGGRDRGADYHSVGALLGRRAKGAILFGEAAEKLRAAWSLFTPCAVVGSLLEAVPEAARNATAGDVVLFSPACSGFDQFRDYEQRGATFCEAVKSRCGGGKGPTPKMHG